MATILQTKKGKSITLLNPAERADKFSQELKTGYAMTNNFDFKYDQNGQMIPLTKRQKAFRSGYLKSRSDSAKVYNAKNKRK